MSHADLIQALRETAAEQEDEGITSGYKPWEIMNAAANALARCDGIAATLGLVFHGPYFVMPGGDERNDYGMFSLEMMLRFNGDDEPLCEWLRAAQIGDTWRTGGASGDSTVTRVL